VRFVFFFVFPFFSPENVTDGVSLRYETPETRILA
jgi:hypothetical protein